MKRYVAKCSKCGKEFDREAVWGDGLCAYCAANNEEEPCKLYGYGHGFKFVIDADKAVAESGKRSAWEAAIAAHKLRLSEKDNIIVFVDEKDKEYLSTTIAFTGQNKEKEMFEFATELSKTMYEYREVKNRTGSDM